jgi:hypothetical protein
MSTPDLEAMRVSLTTGRRTDRLAARISRSLGAPPRTIPSRTALAIEGAATRLVVIATVVCLAAMAATLALREPPVTPPSIISTAMDGRLPPAQEVFATMTGLTTSDEAQP